MEPIRLSHTCRSDESLCETEQDVLRSQLEAWHGRHLHNLSRQGLLHQRVRLPPQLRQTCHQDRQGGTRMAESWKGRMDREGLMRERAAE